jgi:tRNA(Arg) A34 adenosine deaminase TadA
MTSVIENGSGNELALRNDRDPKLETYFMKQALEIAEKALKIGEVPVGCVVVLHSDVESKENNETSMEKSITEKQSILTNDKTEDKYTSSRSDEEELELERHYISSPQVIVSHGSNQVNATRDATRHAECIAIDRMLTGSLSSDKLRLPQHIFLKKMKEIRNRDGSSSETDDYEYSSTSNDEWVNVPSDPKHWKNSYGWGSGKLYKSDVFKRCDLYVTCEPCIMVSIE